MDRRTGLSEGGEAVALKFGFLFSIRNPRAWEKPWDQVYAEMLEQVQARNNVSSRSATADGEAQARLLLGRQATRTCACENACGA